MFGGFAEGRESALARLKARHRSLVVQRIQRLTKTKKQVKINEVKLHNS